MVLPMRQVSTQSLQYSVAAAGSGRRSIVVSSRRIGIEPCNCVVESEGRSHVRSAFSEALRANLFGDLVDRVHKASLRFCGFG